MANAFMASAAKAKRGQKDIEEKKEAAPPDKDEEYTVINIRVRKSLWHDLMLNRMNTGESMTHLLIRGARWALKHPLEK